jgi:hypothetical protein
MTVLRGQVAVVHPDGSAIQPAPSGSTVYAGDEIRTIDESGALITFFAGTELELGENTVLLVQRVSRDGEKIDISLKQVFGNTVSRVQSFVDAGSSYRVEVGGAVALVRGSELFVTGPTCSESGCTVVIHCVDCEEQIDLLQCGGVELPLGPGRRSYRFQVDAIDGSLVGECQALEVG